MSKKREKKSKPLQLSLFTWTSGYRGRAVELVHGAEMVELRS